MMWTFVGVVTAGIIYVVRVTYINLRAYYQVALRDTLIGVVRLGGWKNPSFLILSKDDCSHTLTYFCFRRKPAKFRLLFRTKTSNGWRYELRQQMLGSVTPRIWPGMENVDTGNFRVAMSYMAENILYRRMLTASREESQVAKKVSELVKCRPEIFDNPMLLWLKRERGRVDTLWGSYSDPIPGAYKKLGWERVFSVKNIMDYHKPVMELFVNKPQKEAFFTYANNTMPTFYEQHVFQENLITNFLSINKEYFTNVVDQGFFMSNVFEVMKEIYGEQAVEEAKFFYNTTL